MRILLAIGAFIIAVPALAYAAYVAYFLYHASKLAGYFSKSYFITVAAVCVASAVIGVLFSVAGISMLSGKPRRE